MSGRGASPPPPVVVVGGGVAGLAAATALAERGVRVALLEGAPQLGGRARSFVDATTRDAVDNGPHAVMGCYGEFLHLLQRIGRRDALVERPLALDLWSERGGIRRLACPELPAPLHFAAGLLRYGHLSLRERVSALAAGRRFVARFGSGAGERPDVSVAEALAALGQGAAARRALWDPIAIATLNADPAHASARLFAAVVERALLGSPAASRFLLPACPLSELYTEPARKFLEGRGGTARCRAAATELLVEGGRAVGVRAAGETLDASAVVLALPPAALRRLAPAALAPHDALLATTPIVSVTLWLDRPVGGPDALGLLDAGAQWVFQAQRLHGEGASAPARLACVRSGANDWTGLPAQDVAARALEDVRRALPGASGASLRHALVVKEMSATLAPEPVLQALRPSVETALANVFRAGDWVDTGLPATLESAALAGHRAAAAAAAWLRA